MASHTIQELKWEEKGTKYPAIVEAAVRDSDGHKIIEYYTPLSKLDDYVTTTALTTKLGNYVLTTTFTSELAKYLPLIGGTMTGTLVAPIIQTGTASSNYFQSQKFRGEGTATTYHHAVDFGYSGHNQIDFYEYGGTYNFWKNENSSATSDPSNRVASLQLGKLVERSYTLTYPGKSGTIALTSDIVTYTTATTSTSGLMSASDKSKLDGIESGANKYTLPNATTSVLGGVKPDGTTTTTSSGVITANSKYTISVSGTTITVKENY